MTNARGYSCNFFTRLVGRASLDVHFPRLARLAGADRPTVGSSLPAAEDRGQGSAEDRRPKQLISFSFLRRHSTPARIQIRMQQIAITIPDLSTWMESSLLWSHLFRRLATSSVLPNRTKKPRQMRVYCLGISLIMRHCPEERIINIRGIFSAALV